MNTLDENILMDIARTSIKKTLGAFKEKNTDESANSIKKGVLSEEIKKAKELVNEALIVLPKSFILKTQWIKQKTKEAHDKLYKGYVERFNKVSNELDAVSKSDVYKIRSLKLEEVSNLNAIKLHELYFGNISDLSSQIHRDSLAFIKLSRDWGTFENWQFDFRATALASKDGWVVLYYEPFKNKYINCMIDGDSCNIPLGGIPIIVLDMAEHAYFEGYLGDKESYVNAMMKELNWDIIEARMTIAERPNLKDLYQVVPMVSSQPEKLSDLASNTSPIGKDQILPPGVTQIPAPGSDMQVNPRPSVQESKK